MQQCGSLVCSHNTILLPDKEIFLQYTKIPYNTTEKFPYLFLSCLYGILFDIFGYVKKKKYNVSKADNIQRYARKKNLFPIV